MADLTKLIFKKIKEENANVHELVKNGQEVRFGCKDLYKAPVSGPRLIEITREKDHEVLQQLLENRNSYTKINLIRHIVRITHDQKYRNEDIKIFRIFHNII